MAQVTLKNINKVYNKNISAVKDFNLKIKDKEFIVLVGPSGCGKSTTLRMIAGLEEITSGTLYIGDTKVNDVAPKDRDIAMVFQNYALYPHMTVFENMSFALKLRRINKKEIDRSVREAAEILGIMDLLQRKPKALSGGQRQRVAIGRAIVREPQVFLMDEPLSNLDAKLRNQMRAEILKLRSRINTTFVYVTHDQTEAMTLGDRIVIMKDGDIQQIGTPQEVFNTPKNLFVAGFIGSPQMNFFDARLGRDEDKYHVLIYGIKIRLTSKMNERLLDNSIYPQDIVLGIRPEHMSTASRDNESAIRAKIDVCEMMGSEIHLHLTVEEQDVIIRVPTADIEERYQYGFDLGSEIHFAFSPTLMHLFSKENNCNLLTNHF